MANKIKTITIMAAFSLVTLHPLLLLCLAQASICSSVLLLIYSTWLKMLMCGGCTKCFTTDALWSKVKLLWITPFYILLVSWENEIKLRIQYL